MGATLGDKKVVAAASIPRTKNVVIDGIGRDVWYGNRKVTKYSDGTGVISLEAFGPHGEIDYERDIPLSVVEMEEFEKETKLSPVGEQTPVPEREPFNRGGAY